MPRGATYSYSEITKSTYDLFIMEQSVGGFDEIHFTRSHPSEIDSAAVGTWNHVTFVMGVRSYHVYVKIDGPSYIYRGTYSNPLTTQRLTLARAVVADMMFLGKLTKSPSYNMRRELEEQAEAIAAAEQAKRDEVRRIELLAAEAARREANLAAGKGVWG